jgi:NAD(P)-dependent dehydrogenase (short-subunit alcohol dehydrogenase family)
MQLLATQGFEAGLAWCEANSDQVAEGYAFSKEAVIVWTQFMGAQLIKKGIRINCSLPSPTQTPMMATFHATSGKDVVDAAAEPLGRYTTPEEQAGHGRPCHGTGRYFPDDEQAARLTFKSIAGVDAATSTLLPMRQPAKPSGKRRRIKAHGRRGTLRNRR